MNRNEGERKTSWKQDPEGVKADILAVATSVFAEAGFSGARIDEIIRRTKTSKRMIYYYFGDKSGLYSKVLEAAYARLRKGEGQLDLQALPPLEALAKLAAFTFDFHRNNPEYIRLITIENIHHGKHLKQSETIPKLNSQIIIGL
ncbi:MAG: TetR/AcrR family transcriptional regulator, partial [Pseudomonadota bacterium]